jgi:hypothetical protein
LFLGGIHVEFDIILPISLFFILLGSIIAHQKLEKRIHSLLGERKLGTFDVVLMVLSVGAMITLIAYVPSNAVQIVFIAAYSYMIFSFTYIVVRRWHLAFIAPIIFIALYTLCWNLLIASFFAALFAILITAYMGSLFSWKTISFFAVILTVMDVIQVFWTGHMGEVATKMVLVLRLPVALVLPTYPQEGAMLLGLGDIFLAGLLCIQTASRYGRLKGILTAATTSFAFFIFQLVVFNSDSVGFFPATIIVVAGWAVSLGLIHFLRLWHKAKTSEVIIAK